MGLSHHGASLSQEYPAPSLPTSRHIRLVSLLPGSNDTIICELITADLDSAPHYEALSYTWGNPLDCRTIYIKTAEFGDATEFQVTSNCFSALRRLRLADRPRILWIDAVSIDQHNFPERNHQVTLMSQIYSGAAEVIIYLGESEDNCNLAIEFIIEVYNPNLETTTSLSYPKSEPLLLALRSFFNRPWFSRVWVIQEATLSHRATVYCGDKVFPWSAVKSFHQWNASQKWLGRLPFVVTSSRASLTKSRPGKTMLKALIETRYCAATDPRDKVYGLLPLLHAFDQELNLTPQYEDSVAKVYTDCAAALMTQERFELVLCAVQGGSDCNDLPSWVPDWRNEPKRTILGKNYDIPSDSAWASNDVSGYSMRLTLSPPEPVLHMAGYSCGKVMKVGSTYLAGQGTIPLDEWKALLDKGPTQSLDADPDEASYTVKGFYAVICAADFAYPLAIHQFVEGEKESAKGKQGSSWEALVRRALRKRADGSPSGNNGALPLRDIPFRRAGVHLPPSYRIYVQRVLQHCHSRRFFVTDTGFMGLGPEETRVGDDVYASAGAKIPFILREVDSGSKLQETSRFRLVGECYSESRTWRELGGEPRYLDIV
ncbi:heterokaryon incompatibility protein (HET) domain-containing protein [Trichoderma breve]|uniref:Heterokaryon incompatibility protein (HET) domain-containing protein n=1 Tax=Trichoderma breve TaxID=2034170 RepID=A0A9W9BGX7_9HYPO|nr:heterokaryon incompatibility protein (HET) domain-containing protein [Trichoderma breve]KAJ4860160.1 heterokaryon incompatibility protein (HET) domain-containing protein [Trichoderma breve]